MQSCNTTSIWLRGVMAVALCLFATTAMAERATRDLVLKGDAKCTRCHDETEAYPVLSIGKTRHGAMADARLPGCTGCHGESDRHTNKPEGVKVRPRTDFPFGRHTATDVEGHNKVCNDCHRGGKFMDWAGGAHASRNVACTACHTLHLPRDRVVEKRSQAEVCFTCHKEQRLQINKPSHHPVSEGKVACSDCHASHGSAPKLMARDSVAETCYTCHMEKRGPFIRKHEPSEDCSICHNPHGSAIDNLLKARVPMLCQQCHDPSSHRGGIASLALTGSGHAGTDRRGITMARGCLNCHTNIHGSNNPLNVGNERTFRR